MGSAPLEIFREDSGGKRHKRHPEQEEAIEEQQQGVRPPDHREQPMVIDPHDGDLCEARHVGEVGRPLIEERLEQLAIFSHIVRDLQVEHQQGHRDREHAIAEGLDAGGLSGFRGS